MKKHLSTILLVAVFLLGMCILLYPTVSDYWNSLHQTRAIGAYEDTLSKMTQKDYTAYFEAADAYNAALAGLAFPLAECQSLSERPELSPYEELLDVNGAGIMGYIDIDAIGVELPVYHGTDPSVLNRLLTYEIDQILIVKPEEVDALAIEPGQDLCTLVTCTPYGINSHRLLVRGHRVENAKEKPVLFVPADMVQIDPLVVTPIVAAPMLLILLIFLLIRYRKRS